MPRSKPIQKEIHIRHPVRFKIFLVSLIPTVALLAAALLNNQYLTALGESAEHILSKNYKSIKAAQGARKTLEEIRNQLLGQVSLGRASAPISPQTLEQLLLNLDTCRENVTETGERELIEHLVDLYHRFEPMVHAAGQSKWPDSQVSDFLELTGQMVVLIDDLVVVNEGAMEAAERQTRLLADRAKRNAAFLFGIIITAILVLSYLLSYYIAKPIMALARRLFDIQEGSGVYPQVQPQTKDEIGFLTKSFNRLFRRLEQYDHHRDDVLAAEKEKVRRSEEAKGRFIADISHQLKTPMTSLAMGVGLLHSRGEDLGAEKRARLFATAYDDCSRLTSLINELVDLSRLETLSLPRPKETLDAKIVLRECLAPLVKQAESKGVAIEMELAANLPRVTIDSFRFPWVITNLVGNALRYTGRGGQITLRVFKQGTRFYFQCADTGSGIDPKYLPHIFDRFTQFSDRGKSGTIGLGLAIVKDIIEQHGGDIQVQSRLNHGTTFTFWIPDIHEEENATSADYR